MTDYRLGELPVIRFEQYRLVRDLEKRVKNLYKDKELLELELINRTTRGINGITIYLSPINSIAEKIRAILSLLSEVETDIRETKEWLREEQRLLERLII